MITSTAHAPYIILPILIKLQAISHTAQMLTECLLCSDHNGIKNRSSEPPLQTLTGELLSHETSNSQDGAQRSRFLG